MDPELVVKFKGDLADWNASINKAKADMTALASQATRMAAAFNATRGSTGASANAINTLNASVNSLRRQMTSAATATQANTTALNANTTALGQNRGASDGASNGMGSLLKGYLSIAAVMQGGKIFLDSTKQVQKFENQLKVASGTQQDYAKNTQFLEGLAAKYNKNVIDLGANFAQLTIATRGTNMEGAKTERLFAAVTATSAALQMSVDDTNGTFRAFIQMVSKGNVQAEELRGQLGERLYGAFNMAAKAMGATTQELNKMLENGEVLASDLLPKLTYEMESAFGKDAEENAKNLGSSIEYVTGQMTMLIAEMGKTSGATDGITAATSKFGEFLTKLRLVNKEYGFFTTLFAGASAAGTALIPGEASALDEYATMAKAKQPAAKIAPSIKYPLPRQNTSVVGQLLAGQKVIGELPGEKDPIVDSGNTVKAEKARKAAEAAARKADIASRKWVSEQIQLSNQRIADGLRDAKLAQEQEYINSKNRTGGITAVEMSNTGWDRTVTPDLSGAFTTFSNELGPSTTALERMSHVIAKMNSLDGIYWKDKLGSEKLKEENANLAEETLNTENIANNLNSSLIQMYGSMAAATSAGWADIIAKIKAGTLTYKEALLGLEKLNAIDNIEKMTKDLQIDLVSGIAGSIGEMAAGAGSMEDMMGGIYTTFGTFLSNLGKQLLITSGVFEGLKVALSTLSGPAAAVAGALAIAAGAALKSYAGGSGKKAASSFFSGGIVAGPIGVDRVPVNVSAGEMILNNRQQRNMFNLIDGGSTGRSVSSGSNYGGGQTKDVLITKWSGDDVALVVKRGERKNGRFR